MNNMQVLSASSLVGDSVRNPQGDNLGDIKEIMIDAESGNVAYAVLSFGGFLGIGDKLFAIPWEALQLDTENKRFILDVNEEKLKNAPGFDKDNWPLTPDREFVGKVHSHYGYTPYYEKSGSTNMGGRNF